MRREAARTLLSLSRGYQGDVGPYEVLAVDNGSDEPLDGDWVAGFGPEFSYQFHATRAVSPVAAVNAAARRAQGRDVAVIVDGARMATPGLIGLTQQALDLTASPFVGSLSWHLGPDVQNRSMLDGYDQAVEDRLLDSIAWPQDGHRLFEIATLAPSSAPGFLGPVPAELSWLALRRTTFLEMGGFEPRFQNPGGGLVNHDFRDRALMRGDLQPVMLLGEGVFHQIHGGVATNAPPKAHPFQQFAEEYEAIRGQRYRVSHPGPTPLYLGPMPPAAIRFLASTDA